MDMEKTLLLLNQQIAYARRSWSFYTALPETPLTDLRQLSGFPMVTAEDLSLRGADMLHRCSLHVYNKGMVKPFCANYLTAAQAEN